jgi:phosphoglycolate phosphatase
MVDRMLVDLGVDGLFEEVVGQTDPAHADKASLVSETLRRMDAPATDAVMVGDRSYDVEGAAANGVPCVGVLFGTAPRRELDDAGACVIVEDVDGLGRALLG